MYPGFFSFRRNRFVDFKRGRLFLEVAPTFSQGEFSIHWDPGRLSWQWGRHGRLTMQWLGIDSIAWVPDMCPRGKSWEAAKIDGKRTGRKKHGEKNPGVCYMCLLGMKYGMNKLTVTCLLVCFL